MRMATGMVFWTFLFTGVLAVRADTRTWLSSIGGLWTSTANWQDGVLPGANDVADLSAATGTINLTADVTVGEIYYNPVFSGTTNTLALLSDVDAPSSRSITLTTTGTRRIRVAQGAELKVEADLKPSAALTKDGYGTLVVRRRLVTVSANYVEQGRLVNEGTISFTGTRLCVGTVEPDAGSSAEFVMRGGSSYFPTVATAGSDALFGGNRLLASGTGARAIVTQEGGVIDLTTNATGGVFLNGYAAGGKSVYNLSGGEINCRTKGVYIGFSGTGIVNQTGGILRASYMNFSTSSGNGTYNLTGGELWLGGIAQKGSGAATFNIGGACLYPLATGFNIYDNTSPQLTGINGLTRFCSTGAGFTNTISGLKGVGGFIKEGPDTLNLAGSAHAFVGPMIVSNGTLNVNQALTVSNAVLVSGGTVNLGGVTAKFGSLMVTGGVFQVASNSVLSFADAGQRVRVTGTGTMRFLDGARLVGLTVLDVSENGVIDLSAGGNALIYRFVLDGLEQAPGVYTSANCAAITGSGALVVNGGYWTGAGGDERWSTGANWVAGSVPVGANAVVDFSGAVSSESPVGTLLFDFGGLTNNTLVLDTGVAGAVVTNTCPEGVTNTLTLAADGVIHVGENETLVLDLELALMGSLHKTGEGTLVLRRATYLKPGVTVNSSYNIFVEAGKIIGCGSVTNLLVMVGKPDRSTLGNTPEFVLEDAPEASVCGYTFVSAMNYLTSSLNPGNGVFTQNGGMVEPGISWGTRTLVGFAVSGASLGGTGTYNLANGCLRVTNSFVLAANNGRGVFNQSGGVADIDNLAPAGGEIYLTGGLLKLDRVSNASSAYCTFYLGGGRIETKAFTTTDVTLTSPVVYTGLNGDMTFALESGRSFTLAGASSGTGGFAKEGDGTLILSGAGTFSGPVAVNGGTLTVGGSLSGTNDVLLTSGVFEVSAGGSVRLGTLAVTNGSLSLVSGVVATAKRFFVEGVEWGRGVYASSNCPAITGNGILIIGAEPGQWTGTGGDDMWGTAGNWVAGLIPNGPYAVADLSAVVSNGTPVRTLVMDMGAVTNKQIIFGSGVSGAVLTNTCPEGMTNTLYLASDGTVDVGEGQTLVFDHDLCLMGSIHKRGLGVLVLRHRVYTLPSLVTSASSVYLYVDAGTVVDEGPMDNVMVSVGKLSNTDAMPMPEFILADTPEASIGGVSFITALNASATTPGSGVFTQNGGTVIPSISWGNQLVLAHTTGYVGVPGTGTYNLVKGALIVSNALYFGRNSGAADGHYGVFSQSGGTADIGTLAGRWGEVRLTGGSFKVNAIAVNSGTDASFYFGGGTLEPKGTAWVVIRSPTIFTGINGDMTFAPAVGQTVQLAAVAPASGVGGFIKEGAGALYLSNTNAFVGTAAIHAGTCTVAAAGCLTECTNLLVAADAHMSLQRNGAALNTNLWLKVAADGKVHLDYEGEVQIGHLVLSGYECPGRGRRYGSSAHSSAIDVAKDEFFTGTGVLVVVGPHGPDGTFLFLR